MHKSHFGFSRTPKSGALVRLHISVVLWGFTAILGKLISLQALELVWWRMGLTVLLLAPFAVAGIRKKSISAQKVPSIGLVGLMVAGHWVCFYASIKASNVSLALCCLATTALFSSFLEPLIVGRRYRIAESLAGVVIVPAVYFIYIFNTVYVEGMALGLCSAFLAAIFTSFNKKQVGQIGPIPYTAIQLAGGLAGLSLVLAISGGFAAMTLPGRLDFFWLLILAGALTALPFVLAIKALEQLSAFASTLIVNLEPIYGILLAIVIFGEQKQLNTEFYAGAAIIISMVAAWPVIDRMLKKKEQKKVFAVEKSEYQQ